MAIQKIVLIVEDEKNLREAIADALRLENFLPIETENGQEGVTMALSKHPDLILLDLLMPVMDGIEMLNKLRQDPWGERVPVIILTNLGDQEKISETVENDIYGYLIKSDWKLEDIVKKVKEKLV